RAPLDHSDDRRHPAPGPEHEPCGCLPDQRRLEGQGSEAHLQQLDRELSWLLRPGRSRNADRVRGERHRAGADYRQRDPNLQRRPRELHDRELTSTLRRRSRTSAPPALEHQEEPIMSTTGFTSTARRELARRVSGGLEIALFWDRRDNSTSID